MVYLYYKHDPPYLLCVVARHLNGEGYIITVYRTDKIKRGELVWTKIYYDEEGKTLTVWFDDPSKEFLAEETGEDFSLIKDKDGRVIGFERLNYSLEKPDAVQVELISV